MGCGITRPWTLVLLHNGFQKLTVNWHGPSAPGPIYTNIFTDRSKGANRQFTVVADYIRQRRQSSK
jgi:hypothetical protein